MHTQNKQQKKTKIWGLDKNLMVDQILLGCIVVSIILKLYGIPRRDGVFLYISAALVLSTKSLWEKSLFLIDFWMIVKNKLCD